MRWVAWPAVAILLAGCGGDPPTRAPRTGAIADGADASRLSAYGGHLVFSRRDGSRYALMHWHAGRLEALPVPPRAIPFDADAGPDEHGRAVVVYSRCARDATIADEPDYATSRGCRIMQLRLDAPSTPSDLHVEGTLPSRWRGRLAYVRGRELHIDGRTRALPRAATQVEALDLGPRAAVFTWATERATGIGEGWTLQLTPLDGSPAKRMVEGYISGACGFVRPYAPTALGVGAFWIASGATCDTTKTIFAAADLHYAHPRSATDPNHLILGAARDATATYWLRGPRTAGDVPYQTLCQRVRCTLMREPALRWRARTPGRPFGPHPH
jgi:hypothetical protein